MNRVFAAVAVGLVVVLGAVGVVAGGEEQAPERPRPSMRLVTQRVAEIARGVERARQLEFEGLPRVRVVSVAEARRAGLAELDRYVPLRVQRIDERLLKMLGLLPPGARFRQLMGRALEQEVAGYYVPRTDTLALVRGSGLGGLLAEVALAHELGHALEDQHFGLEPDAATGSMEDRTTAQGALHEGSATLVMVDYLGFTRGDGALPDELRGAVLEQLEGVALPESSGLPRYLRESFVFPYAAGARFVDRIQGEGGWAAVDRAFGAGAPVSTEQIMHPEKYEEGERPARVRLAGHRDLMPPGARVVARGDIGEFDTAQFLRGGNGRARAEEAAAGWGGSAFELWRLRRERHVLAVLWAWDTTRDAVEFASAARRAVEPLPGAGAVNVGNEGDVAVVVAPDAALTRRVARAIAR